MGLRQVPYPRPNLDLAVDHSLSPDWSVSPVPRMFWKAFKRPMASIDFFYQGLYDYPFFEQSALNSNFLWKDAAFMYKLDRGRGVEYGSVDYLYSYWMARYAGLLRAGDGQ